MAASWKSSSLAKLLGGAAWLYQRHVTHGALVGACGAPAIRDEAGSQDAIVVGRCAAREGRSAHVVLVRSLRAHARHSTLFNHFHRTGLLSALALARGTGSRHSSGMAGGLGSDWQLGCWQLWHRLAGTAFRWHTLRSGKFLSLEACLARATAAHGQQGQRHGWRHGRGHGRGGV